MEAQIVEEAVQGDPEALGFLRAMARVLHFFDDCMDRDKPISDAAIEESLWLSLVTLPRNAFYRKHFESLNPILVTAIVNWRIANDLERQRKPTKNDLTIAFIIRSTYVDLVTMSATIIAGADWAVAHGPAIRRWAHKETLIGYIDNLAAETRAREGA